MPVSPNVMNLSTRISWSLVRACDGVYARHMGVLPCQSVLSTNRFVKAGRFQIAPIGSGPPVGGIIINAGTWTVSNYDPSGIDIRANLAGLAGKTVYIKTLTGSNQLAVTTVTPTADRTTLVGTQSNAVGTVSNGQYTSLALSLPAGVLCNATAVADFDPAEHTVPEVKEFVEQHPDVREEVLQAEQEGKGRVTLIEALEDDA